MTAMLADTRKVLTLSNENPVAYYLQAVLAARAHKYDLARSLYRRTGGSFDNQPSGMLLASALDLEAGNVEQSIARLGRLVAMQPANRKARRLLAAAYWKKGDAAATINALRPIADRPDADSYSLSLMGQALAKQGKIEDASIYLARAAQPQSRSATALRPPVSDEELAAIRSTAALNPEDASAQVALVGALLSRGMGEDALALALRIRADNPGAPDAHILVGDARGLRGDFRGAAEEYRKAANLVFTETVAMRMIEALRRSGQGAAATEVLNLFLQQNPRNVPALLLAAGNMMAGGQWAAASRIYEGLRSRLGDNDAVMLNNLAWAYSQQGDYERAIPLARRAWELDSRNPATTDTLGWLLFKSGKDRALGLALLRRAARGAPTDAQIRQHLREAQQG